MKKRLFIATLSVVFGLGFFVILSGHGTAQVANGPYNKLRTAFVTPTNP